MAEPLKNDENITPGSLPDFKYANRISVGTLVRLLIRKGVLSIEELVNEEREARELQEEMGRKSPSYHLQSHDRHNQSWFKCFAARHKTMRRLTSYLFGWKWKKHYRK